MKKLGISTLVGLTRYAVRTGRVDLSAQPSFKRALYVSDYRIDIGLTKGEPLADRRSGRIERLPVARSGEVCGSVRPAISIDRAARHIRSES
jgi:hypothetical protein